MEAKLAQIEQEHKQAQAKMRERLSKMEAEMESSQDGLLQKIEEMFKKHATSGKAIVDQPKSSDQDLLHPPGFEPMASHPVRFTSGPQHPPGFTPDPSHPPGFTPVHISVRSPVVQEAHPGVYIANQQNHNEPVFQIDHPPAARARPIELGVEELPPDFQEVSEKGRVNSDITQQLKSMEERMRSVELEPFYGMDARELSLVPDLILPSKFKAPDFEKYDGTTCPSAHLVMFCRRMTGYTENEKLLIHCFHDSLTGSTIKWYNQLTRSQIKSWRDLARAFYEQYHHVTELVPDRWTLQNMEKRHNETFRQYAQRWRDVASQVQPPLLEKEATIIFVHTLKAPYLGHMLGNATKNFADLPKTEKTNTHENRGQRRENTIPTFLPMPVPYSEIYASLLKADLIHPYKLTPMQPPYPHWYNANAHCEYHAGIAGHDIENFPQFKKVVQNLINAGDLEFKTPAVNTHPMPNHGGQGINMVEEEEIRTTKRNVSEVKSPICWVFRQLCTSGMIKGNPKSRSLERETYCEHHQTKDHDIQNYTEFRELLQKMMDSGEVEFFSKKEKPREIDICMMDDSGRMTGMRKPIVITINPGQERSSSTTPRVVITTSSPFLFKDTRQVPWSYTTNVSIPEGSKLSEGTNEENNSSSDEVSEVGHFTRSERCYSPDTSLEVDKGKAKAKAVVMPKIFNEEPPPIINEPVTEAQGREFLRFLKHSEYNIVEQLHKQHAKISILDLLINSEVHRNALLKVLNQTFVPEDISTNKLDRIMGHIAADNYITFTDDEIPEGGMGSIKALNIIVHCHSHVLPGVLIDNGSALNVMPFATLQRMPIDSSHMRAYHNIVRAFDGTQKDMMGRMEIPLMIGLAIYNVDFVIMDIHLTYNCLLGRPWIHAAGAVPSSLHQKLKFIIDRRLVSIGAEQEIIASVTSETPYIDINEDTLECSFRALEFINATYVAEDSRIPRPALSNYTKMTVRQTLGRGAKIGKGLGKELQGQLRHITVEWKNDRFGLGFKPTFQQRGQEMKKKNQARKARLR
ncbi:uncharacterized protein LOC120153320 [Hibiscus syriacus]|uniref:uncharacterized protein LOC120153320 n=1 Tax=Hibiscus syriacus TaxID=106335 RepID=UPI001924A94E|nr:uncharacterized protein LOC120153320 [Hibiscus syriacus]